jgi:hypothetical protein
VVLETRENKSKETTSLPNYLTTKQGNEPFASESGISGKPLKKVHPDEMTCPECGGAMVLSEGCMHCASCGYAKCGM